MKKILIKSLLFSVLLLGSCSKDFLDVSKELSEERDMEKLFSNPGDVRRFHRSIYNGIPNTGNFWHPDNNGQDNPWTFLADELENSIHNSSGYDGSSERSSRWGFYREIRQANVFLANAKVIPQTGTTDFLEEAELTQLRAQAKFFRAYYHYLLFELYGPIPIMDRIADPADPNIDFPRNSVDEVVDFIYKDLTEAAADLEDPNLADPTRLAVPTKGTALAVRARLMAYAASPLYNGGYTEALALRNLDGKQLFPAADPSKWNRALDAIQDFIDYANSGHYELHKAFTNGVLDPYKSVYEVYQSYNKEIIFARSDVGNTLDAVTDGSRDGIDGRSTPWAVPGAGQYPTTGNIGLVQEYVDDFFMMDGLSIDESPLYNKATESNLSVAGEDKTGQNGAGVAKMYINREPRFYNSVFYNGRRWPHGTLNASTQIWFYKANVPGNSGRYQFNPNGTVKAANNVFQTGYTNYKRVNKSVFGQGTPPRSFYRPLVIFRLAEFYLLYAEILNEVTPGDPKVLEYVDKVRERAGIPKLSVIKPQIIGNQDLQREAIRQEMRVELSTEGQRYFDVRRWMIAENAPGEGGQGGQFHAMNVDGTTLGEFHTRTPYEVRVFTRRMYLYPIPLREVQNSKAIIQNPGY